MSTRDQELELMLGRDLHDQVDGMTGVHFGVDDVKGRARRIRRNRQISAGVGAAAALAVIIPVAITAGGGPKGKDEIQPAPSPDVPAEVARTTLTLDGLERGDAPALEYFTPDGVVLPGEGTQPLPEQYQALVRSEAHAGWLALGPARGEVIRLTEDLQPQDSSPAGNGFVTTPERDLVSWTVPSVSGPEVISVRSTTDPDAVMSWKLPGRPGAEPVGILGPDSVVYVGQGGTTPALARADGTTVDLPYLTARAADPVNDLIAVQTEVRGSSGCFGVVAAATLEVTWETCDYKLGTFSPGGEYVVATAADSDGQGPSSLYVLDARTGELVAEFASRGRKVVSLIRPAWESPVSIVATALEGDTTTMVRMSVDGTLEEIVDPVATSDHGDLFYVIGQDRAVL